MSDVLSSAVIRAEPEGYDMSKPQLMGRQSAGSGFLRAAVKARGDATIYGYTASQAAAAGFREMVRAIDPSAPFDWVHADQLGRISQVGVLYVADATVAKHTRLRMRAGMTAFSVCGVTHTTASHGVMDEITDLLREAAMPWDALICTSTSVVETVRRVHEAEADYLKWRYRTEVSLQAPQLPLIPLGVHCDDFQFSEKQRVDARRALGIAEDEVVGLFVGRLVFHAKAHPWPTLRACQLAAERTGKKITLIFSGWAPSAEIEQAFKSGAAQFAPDVKTLFVEGRDPVLRAHAWAASDMFLSPSDNIQETFGLTPIEAMAAGMPVVVSDYDGYRDTVRHKVDGFRVKTWAPAAGAGQAIARAHETGSFNYDQYCWAAASMTAVDVEGFADAVVKLVSSEQLRREMGAAGRRRAREVYDWAVVYRQYQELWADLNARRAKAATSLDLQEWLKNAPAASSARLDPFHTFGHYPSASLGPATRLYAAGASTADLRSALAHPLFGSLSVPHELLEQVFEAAQAGDLSVNDVAAAVGASSINAVRAVGILLKTGMLRAGS